MFGSIDDISVEKGISLKYNKKVRRKVPGKAKLPKRMGKEPIKGTFRLSAYCTCQRYSIDHVILKLTPEYGSNLTVYSDILEVKGAHHEIYVFGYGCVVYFNVTEAAERKFNEDVLGPLAVHQLTVNEFEDFEYNYGEKSLVVNDTITLESVESLEKLSVALALAQCVKLNVYEEEIEKEIASNQDLPQMLAREGRITLSQHEISKKIGKLFIVRNDVNLHFDVLDTPEFFWEQDRYKPVYDRLFKYLELGKRVELLNNRLEIMKELFDMLSEQLENKQAARLEWIIIWLIVIEVVMMVLSDVLKVFHN